MTETQAQQEEIEIDLGKIIRGLQERGRLLAIAAILSGIAALVLSLLLPVRYEAGAVFYIRNNLASAGSISSADIAASKDLVDSCLIILKSGETLEAVASYAHSSKTREQVAKMISASAVNGTEFFEVIVTASSPGEAERFAKAIVQVLPERISRIMEGSAAKIVDAAVDASKPGVRQHGVCLAVGTVLGLAAAVILISVQTVLDKTILSRKDVQKTCAVPILAELFLGESGMSENYKLLRSKLRHRYPPREHAWILGIAGTANGDGGGQTAVNLAAGLTKLGYRVLWVGCDLRGKQIPAAQQEKRGYPGLGNYLSGNCEKEALLRWCNVSGTDIRLPVITAGNCTDNPSDLLSCEKMKELLDSLRDSWDYILLDLPPVKNCSGMLDAAKYTEGILLQVCQGLCNTDTLQQTLEQLQFLEIPVSGIVYAKAAEKSRKKKKPV